MSNLILIGGGSRSGKSRYAVSLAETLGQRRTFIATAQAFDSEMQSRIHRHQVERADRFRTVECPLELPAAIRENAESDVIVVDCLTLWITNLLGENRTNDEILSRVDDLIAAATAATASTIVVSNEVGMGLVSLHELGRRFQDLTGWAHQRLSRHSTQIYLAALGCVLRIKPSPITLVDPNTDPI